MGVRYERVVLQLEDDFSTPMARAAANTALLDREIEGLSRDAVKSRVAMRDLGRETDGLGRSARNAGPDIDRLSGRLRILTDIALALGPGLAPVGSVGIAAFSGLASALGFTTIGVASTALAFRGFGDVLDTVNKAQLEPTAENIRAAQEAMADLHPEAQAFLMQLRYFRPALDDLSDAAASGLFPGLGRSLVDLEAALPRVERVVRAITTAVGEAAEDSAESLARGDWDEFLDFVGTEGPIALAQLTAAAGNTAHAVAGLWMATGDVNQDFLTWLVDATERFDQWANGLEDTEGFQNFVDYLRENGPQVAETAGAIGNALVEITQAIAPLGGPSLQILEGIADAIATIADSPVGTPLLGLAAGMAALNTASRVYGKTVEIGPIAKTRQFTQDLRVMRQTGVEGWGNVTREIDRQRAAASRVQSTMRGFGKTTLQVGALAAASSGMADEFGVANTVSLALAGSIAGPWGAAIGGGIGLALDLAKAVKSGNEEMKSYADTVKAVAGEDPAEQLRAVNEELTRQEALVKSLDLRDGQAFGELARYQPGISRNDDKIRDARAKIKALEKAQEELEGQSEETTAAQEYLNSSFGRSAIRAERHEARLRMLRQEAGRVAESFLAFDETLNDAEVSLDQWLSREQAKVDAMNKQAENARKAAARGLGAAAINKLLSSGPDGALRLQQLANGSERDIARYNRAIRSGVKATENLKDSVDDINRRQMRINAKPAIAEIERVRERLQSLWRAFTFQPQLAPPAIRAPEPQLPAWMIKPAMGTTVPGPRWPYRDSVPALLAPGEEVVSNSHGQADRNRPLLKAINDNRLALGGTIGNPMYLSGSSNPAAPSFAYAGVPVQEAHNAIVVVRRFKGSLEETTKTLDRERSKREALISARNELAGNVRTGLRRDLFSPAETSSVWMSAADRAKAGVGDAFSILRGDISNARAYRAALRQLDRKALDGNAFAALAATGDLQTVQAYAGLSRGRLDQFEDLYNRREQLTADVGRYAGQAAYGEQIAIQTAVNRRLAREVAAMKKSIDAAPKKISDGVSKAINRTVPRGTR